MASPDLLLIGCHGQLGRAVSRCAEQQQLSCHGYDIDTLDITDRNAVLRCVSQERPLTLVNCAAFTAVDRCEEEQELAMTVNGSAVGYLAEACNDVGAKLVHISSDYVFSGNGERPYREDDPTGPASVYGRSKLRGERAAAKAMDHLILRTAWLCGVGGRNFVEAIRSQIEQGKPELRVVDDQRGSPTFCDDLAEMILGLIARYTTGVLHAVNHGDTTWCGFATEIARQLKATVDIIPISSRELDLPAPRPAYSVLDTSRLAKALGSRPQSWQAALTRYLSRSCEP